METKTVTKGFAIVVVDRGFVYVGDVEHDGEWCIVRHCHNIRIWGTKEGLGELARKGPQPGTKLDPVGIVHIPARAIISLIDTEATLWKLS